VLLNVHGDRLMTRVDWLARFLVLPLAAGLEMIFGFGEEPLGTQGPSECLENVPFMAPTLVTDLAKRAYYRRKGDLFQKQTRPISIFVVRHFTNKYCVDKERDTYNLEKELTFKKRQN
jgi:hypothetical protein